MHRIIHFPENLKKILVSPENIGRVRYHKDRYFFFSPMTTRLLIIDYQIMPETKILTYSPTGFVTMGFSLFASKCLMISFANSLDPDQAQNNVGPDLGQNRLTPIFRKH